MEENERNLYAQKLMEANNEAIQYRVLYEAEIAKTKQLEADLNGLRTGNTEPKNGSADAKKSAE